MTETVDPKFDKAAGSVDLPPRIFLYTLDQVAECLGMEQVRLRHNLIYFAGRTTGVKAHGMIMARNIAGPKSSPDWRVAENELVRWMKFKGFVFVLSSRLME